MVSVDEACPCNGGMEQRVSIPNGTLESSLEHLNSGWLAHIGQGKDCGLKGR